MEAVMWITNIFETNKTIQSWNWKKRWADKNLTWHVTQRVWHNWVFPERNSPYISVIDPVSIPPVERSYHNAKWSRSQFTFTNSKGKEWSWNERITLQDLVKLSWSSCNLNNLQPLCMKLAGTCKPKWNYLRCCKRFQDRYGINSVQYNWASIQSAASYY